MGEYAAFSETEKPMFSMDAADRRSGKLAEIAEPGPLGGLFQQPASVSDVKFLGSKNLSLRAQRGNLVDHTRTRFEMAASPAGRLAMTMPF